MTINFNDMEAIFTRPKPYELYTSADLWTDEHTSKQMLACHLDDNVDLSSRNGRFVKRSLDWILKRFDVKGGTNIADFGCGPGLYALPLAQQGACVTGIDFSQHSLDYAREQAKKEDLSINYVCADYLDFETDERFDLILMIFCDLCALSPAQRSVLLKKFRTYLNPQGKVLLDVCSLAGFANFKEGASVEANPQGGFWSPKPYYAFTNSFKYDVEKVSLDKYTIVEADRIRRVYNWLQYYDPASVKAEFAFCGLHIDEVLGSVAGDAYDKSTTEFAIIAGLD
jgi:SAM-dependent methyltransferase